MTYQISSEGFASGYSAGNRRDPFRVLFAATVTPLRFVEPKVHRE